MQINPLPTADLTNRLLASFSTVINGYFLEL